jgi:hypothetical protein
MDQGVQGAPEALGHEWLFDKSLTLRLGVDRRGRLCAGDMVTPSLGGEAP